MPWSTNRGVPGNHPRRLSGGCTKAALCLLHSIRNACQNSFRCKFTLKSHEIRARWKGLAHMSHVLSLEPGGGGGETYDNQEPPDSWGVVYQRQKGPGVYELGI